MDPTSLIFLILMVLVTGGMAFAGDSLGRYLGKKRVTIGKIRPKHTAGILTATAGGLGAVFVILVLMGVSDQVRVWIISGNQARRDLDVAQKELNQIKQEKDRLQGEVNSSGEKLSAANKNYEAAEKRSKDLSSKNQNLSSKNQSLQAKNTQIAAEIAAQTKRVAGLTGELASIRSGLAKVRSQYQKAKGDAARISSDNVSVQKRNLLLTQQNAEMETQKTRLENTAKELTASKKVLEESIETLTSTFDKTSKEQRELLAASQEQLTHTNEQLAQTGSLLEGVRTELASLYNERAALMTLSEASRNNPMVVERLDELTRVPLPPNLSLAEARSLILGAVQKASVSAVNKGAGVTRLSKSAVLFAEVQRPNQMPITAEMQEDALADEVAGKPEERILVLRALVNSFTGEPVPLDAAIYRNPVVYQMGQVVAETRLDGRGDQDEIAGALAEFFKSTMAPKVLKDGLIPIKGSSQPLGELSRDAVMRIVQAVKASQVSVKVQFLAAEPTRAGDQLKLDFRLR